MDGEWGAGGMLRYLDRDDLPARLSLGDNQTPVLKYNHVANPPSTSSHTRNR